MEWFFSFRAILYSHYSTDWSFTRWEKVTTFFISVLISYFWYWYLIICLPNFRYDQSLFSDLSSMTVLQIMLWLIFSCYFNILPYLEITPVDYLCSHHLFFSVMQSHLICRLCSAVCNINGDLITCMLSSWFRDKKELKQNITQLIGYFENKLTERGSFSYTTKPSITSEYILTWDSWYYFFVKRRSIMKQIYHIVYSIGDLLYVLLFLALI